MATKLKKMKLTSVDLVRAGANQEADICLYKSADPQEAAGGPTEDEMGIFKRFIAFIRGTPTEAKNEPHSHVEKAQEPEGPADLESIYKSALADSIHSIYTDGSLTEVEKKAMAELSIGQFQEKMKESLRDRDDEPEDQDDDHEEEPDEEDRYDDIEEIETPVHKFNPNHDADGKFSSSGGGAGAAHASGGGVAEHVKTLNSLPTKRGMRKVTYEEAKTYASVLNKMPVGTKLSQKTDAGTDTYEKTSDSEIGINWKHTSASSAPSGKEYAMTSIEMGQWLAGNAVIARGPIELMKSSPNESSVRKYNQNHGRDGKFTSGGGGGAAAGAAPSPGGEVKERVKERVKELNNLPKKNGTSHVGYEEIAAYEKVLNKMPKGTKLSQRIVSGTDTFERINDSKIGPSWKHTRSPWGTVEHKSSFDVGRLLAGSGYIARGQIEIAN